MAGWPNDEAVRRAAAVLTRIGGETGEIERVARETLTAAGLPELVGAKQVAAILGTDSGNLGRWPSLPGPLFDLPSGRLWDAAVIRAFARERKRARR